MSHASSIFLAREIPLFNAIQKNLAHAATLDETQRFSQRMIFEDVIGVCNQVTNHSLYIPSNTFDTLLTEVRNSLEALIENPSHANSIEKILSDLALIRTIYGL
jgi:hypothetical protein